MSLCGLPWQVDLALNGWEDTHTRAREYAHACMHGACVHACMELALLPHACRYDTYCDEMRLLLMGAKAFTTKAMLSAKSE